MSGDRKYRRSPKTSNTYKASPELKRIQNDGHELSKLALIISMTDGSNIFPGVYMSRNRSYVTAKIGRGYFYTTEITPIMKIVVGGLVSYAVFPTFTLVFGGLLIAFFIWLFIALETPIKVDPEVYTDNLVNRLSKLDINILLENKSATEDLLKKELTNRFDRHLGQSVRDGLERSYYYAHATKNEEIIKLLKPHVIIIFEEEYAQYLFDEKNTINLKQRLTTKLEELNKAEEEEDKEFRLKYELAQNLD